MISMSCIFCQIANKEIKSQIVFENESVVAFNDISPQAPIHILIIPKKHISTFNDLSSNDCSVMGQMTEVAIQIAKEKNIAENGYRTVINCNRHGGQTVFHLHMHLLGGRQLGGGMVG